MLAALTACGGGGGSTSTSPSSAHLSLTALPATVSVYPASGFQLNVKASVSGTTALPSITLGALPAGITTNNTFPMTVPDSGVTIDFNVAGNMAAGSYSIPINGTAGSATATSSTPVTVLAGTPTIPWFTTPLSRESSVIQGSSTTLQFFVMASSPVKVTLSATGLPSGTTAHFNPQQVQTGNPFSVTIYAESGAPVAHNVVWSVEGTTDSNVRMPSLPLLLNVTGPSDVGFNNRTDYVSTRATPFGAVYDRAHQLIYVSNQMWNRVDIVSNVTHAIVGSVPVRDPRGLDLSIDGTRVWVATGSQVMYGIDTTTFKATRYQLPRVNGSSWEGMQVFSLVDGSVLLSFTQATGGGIGYVAIWAPAANSLTQLSAPHSGNIWAQWGIVARSGDGKFVFSVRDSSDETCFSYDVLNKVFSTPSQLAGFGFGLVVNNDGSRLAITDYNSGFNLYDRNFIFLGSLPGDGGLASPIDGSIFGGSVFSPDGSTLYEETLGINIPFIVTIDVATRKATALAPAMPVIPVMVELVPPFYVPVPFDVDDNGMVLGVQYHGISFDDSLAHMNYVEGQPGSPIRMQHSDIYSGPVAGGTTSGGFGNSFSIKPDVYYGSVKGTATLSQMDLQITSPPATVPGPVNVKMLFADGVEVFNPQFFTYGTYLQDALLSGAPPEGNVPGKLSGFGLPIDPTQDIVTVGANRGTVTSVPTQLPPYTGEQTAMFLSYTVPAGIPGWADISVKTSNGTGTLPKSFFYANTVNDYASSDKHTFVLYDRSRNKLFLSAGDHINVFSLTSNTFLAPLQPPAIGTNEQFQGLALTPDNKYLLAADLLDGSLAVIDPDTPSNSYAVSVAEVSTADPRCTKGPLFTAATDSGQAVVVTGGVIGIGCGPGGQALLVDLTARTSKSMDWSGCRGNFANEPSHVSATHDGSMVAININGLEIYSTARQQCTPPISSYLQYGAVAAGDGNVFATLRAFVDPSGNIMGRMAAPPLLYPGRKFSAYYNYSPYVDGALQNPALNDSGSLYYWAYPNYIDIVDVQHGMEKLRFSLGRTVSNTVSPMAIDADGQQIYLITDRGLTIVDLGHAPLSIGHLSQSTATGADIVIRGSGFQNGITLTVGGRDAAVTYTDSSSLTFTVPSVDAGLQDLVLTNPDGITYTLENGLTVQ